MNQTRIMITILIRVVNILFVVFMLFPFPSSLQKLNPNLCIDFVPSTYTIRVACGSATLTDIYNIVNRFKSALTKPSDVLIKESANGDWLLKANLEIRNGSSFTIDSTDTKWLKIYSDDTTAYNIKIYGSMKIDSVKITSWNPVKNDYPSVEDSDPRAYISVQKEATGTTDIFNSELGYLGYNSSYEKDFIPSKGFSYYGGNGSILRNNNIHNNYFGFYSAGVGNMLIENNQVHHNTYYGLDPHSGTHDMIIRNNVVHNNGRMGIICSAHCRNITIENNEVYRNIRSGISLSIDMRDSVVRDNVVYSQDRDGENGISVSNSSNNKIHNNTISFSDEGIKVINNSSDNYVYNNTLQGIKNYPILVRDSDVVNNTFENNDIVNSSIAVRLYNNTESLFVGNNGLDNFSPGHQYVVQGNSTLSFDRTIFPSWTNIKSDNASNNIVNIVDSGIISVKVGEDVTSTNTRIMPFSSRITNGSLQLISFTTIFNGVTMMQNMPR